MNDTTAVNSEKHILATLMKYPDYFHEFGVRLTQDVFSSYPNRVILETIKELSRDNLHPEINLMVEHLSTKGKLDEAGGIQYLEEIYATDVEPTNVKKYVEIVENAHLTRLLFSLSAEIPSKITSGGEPQDVVSYLRTKLNSLDSSAKSGQKTFAVSDLVEKYTERLKNRIENPGIPGTSIGYPSLDYFLGGAEGGEVIVVGGRPGIGKTRFAINSVAHHNEKSLFFSREMSWERLMDNLVSLYARVPSNDIRFGSISKEQAVRVKSSIDFLEKRGETIWIDEHFFSDLDYILAVIRKYKHNHDIKYVYIDYLQLISERSADAVNEIGRIIRSLKLLAEELRITIFVLSQLNRGSELRENTRPVISDLRQSGNIEEDADIVILLHRNKGENNELENVLEVIIGKGRYSGQGVIRMDFHGEIGLIEDRSESKHG